MLSPEAVESLRRSHAMAPLNPRQVDELLAACAAYAHCHRELIAVLDELRQTFPTVRELVSRMTRLTSTARERLQLAVAVTTLTDALEPVRTALNRLAHLAVDLPR